MLKSRRKTELVPLDDTLRIKRRKPVPHAFVLEAIAPLSPYTRPMFGCLAIYVNDKIVLILRDKPKSTADNGVWLATAEEHHESLRREFPNMRSIQVVEKPVTAWQVLPADAPDFEEAALRACELVLAGDPRTGKIPGARASKSESKVNRKSTRQVRAPKSPAGLAVLVGAVSTLVFFKGFLRQAVEGEGTDGAFEARRGQTPRAVGAAPVGEVVPFDPNQAFIHTSSYIWFCCDFR